MEPPKVFSLAELVKTTADELRAIHADEPAADKAVMKFTECEIELAVTVKADAKGKVKFWVVEGGLGGGYENGQKVTLKFSALPNVGIMAALQDTGVAPLPKGPDKAADESEEQTAEKPE
jgi:hypothetical protein